MKLTDIEIRKTKYQGKNIKLSDGNGLYILILKKSKHWYLKYTCKGKRIETPLGKYSCLNSHLYLKKWTGL
ncbi:MAG: Arm DNA-binding domain-containing protein [Ostreibacterium sp.]